MRRRSMMLGSLAAAGVASVAACGQGTNPANQADTQGSDGGSGVNLRFAWWGGSVQSRLTQEAVDAFESQHPDITVTPESLGWDGYWDRISTATAAGDAPDIINMDEQYLRTYAEQGSLLDLHSVSSLDTSEIDPLLLPTGEVDGQLFGIPNALNALAIVANVELLAKADVEIPDDTAWTWDDFIEISRAVTEGTDDGIWGVQRWGMVPGELFTWTDQLGETIWTESGEFGLSEESLTQWLEFIVELEQKNAMPPPSLMQELHAAGNEGSGTATNTAAFGLWWSNEITYLSENSGQELILLQPPKQVTGGDSGLYYKPSQFWSVAATTDHAEEAGIFLDFLTNSNEAGEVLMATRGAPSNMAVREHIQPMLPEVDLLADKYLDAIADETNATYPMTPDGVPDLAARMQRTTLDVLFGNVEPAAAAKAFKAEIEGLLG